MRLGIESEDADKLHLHLFCEIQLWSLGLDCSQEMLVYTFFLVSDDKSRSIWWFHFLRILAEPAVGATAWELSGWRRRQTISLGHPFNTESPAQHSSTVVFTEKERNLSWNWTPMRKKSFRFEQLGCSFFCLKERKKWRCFSHKGASAWNKQVVLDRDECMLRIQFASVKPGYQMFSL